MNNLHAERFWETHPKGVQCHLCPHGCKLGEGQKGICRVRINQGGKLYSTNYGQVSSIALDPIEKKPLYMYSPGSSILSVGTLGCNLKCSFCQNYSIAHYDRETQFVAPEQLVDLAIQYQQSQGNIGVAFTYSEPLMWYEYVFDTAKLLQAKGLKVVLVSNGYIQEEPFAQLLPYIDAMNIDLKAFTDRFYGEYCQGAVDPVKERIAQAVSFGCHVEVTTLLIPGANDDPKEISKLSAWLATLDEDIPLHLSRYFPNYKLELPPTDLDTMVACYQEAKQHLAQAFLGNCPELRTDKILSD